MELEFVYPNKPTLELWVWWNGPLVSLLIVKLGISIYVYINAAVGDNYPCYMSNPFFKRITVIRICFLKTFLPAAVTWVNIVVTMVSWWRHRYSLYLVWINDRANRTLVDVRVTTCFHGFSATVSRETASQVIYLIIFLKDPAGCNIQRVTQTLFLCLIWSIYPARFSIAPFCQ